MPNDIGLFVPWRIIWYCYQQLHSIQKAAGYNCDADVYFADLEGYHNSSAKWALLMFSDGDTAEDHNLGGGGGGPRVNNAVNITIMGSINYDTEHPVMAQMALEQDVRTALHAHVADARPLVGRGVVLRWTGCQRYVTALSAEKQSGFTLNCSFMYPQGSTW